METLHETLTQCSRPESGGGCPQTCPQADAEEILRFLPSYINKDTYLLSLWNVKQHSHITYFICSESNNFCEPLFLFMTWSEQRRNHVRILKNIILCV